MSKRAPQCPGDQPPAKRPAASAPDHASTRSAQSARPGPISCKACSKPFASKSRAAQYCSRSCSGRARSVHGRPKTAAERREGIRLCQARRRERIMESGDVRGYLLMLLRKHKTHGRRDHDKCDLDEEWLSSTLTLCGSRCMLSGIPFDMKKRWLRPSIDAIDPSKPHTRENCQIVLLVLQYGKNSWSLDVFMDAVACVVERRPMHAAASERLLHNRSRKGCRPLATVRMDEPLQMTPMDAVVFRAMRDDACDTTRKVRELAISQGLQSVYKDTEQAVRNSVKRLRRLGYVAAGAMRLTDTQAVNRSRDIRCSNCRDRIPLEELRIRDDRSGRNKTSTGKCTQNLYCTLCNACRTRYSMTSRGRTPQRFLWSQIQPRTRKLGDVSACDMSRIATPRCAISGAPIQYVHGGTPLQASVDRISNKAKYETWNIRTVALVLQYARMDFDVSDAELLSIFRETHSRRVVTHVAA